MTRSGKALVLDNVQLELSLAAELRTDGAELGAEGAELSGEGVELGEEGARAEEDAAYAAGAVGSSAAVDSSAGQPRPQTP